MYGLQYSKLVEWMQQFRNYLLLQNKKNLSHLNLVQTHFHRIAQFWIDLYSVNPLTEESFYHTRTSYSHESRLKLHAKFPSKQKPPRHRPQALCTRYQRSLCPLNEPIHSSSTCRSESTGRGYAVTHDRVLASPKRLKGTALSRWHWHGINDRGHASSTESDTVLSLLGVRGTNGRKKESETRGGRARRGDETANVKRKRAVGDNADINSYYFPPTWFRVAWRDDCLCHGSSVGTRCLDTSNVSWLRASLIGTLWYPSLWFWN